MNYSLWIIPPQPIRAQLQTIIDELADRHHGPKFPAHMTLASGIPTDIGTIKTILAQITAARAPLRLSLGPVSFSTTYFQSVFARVNSTAALMQLNLDIKKALGLENGVFMPHISLLYGDHDMATREKAASGIHLPQDEFIGEAITLIPELPNPDQWIPEGVYPLQGFDAKPLNDIL